MAASGAATDRQVDGVQGTSGGQHAPERSVEQPMQAAAFLSLTQSTSHVVQVRLLVGCASTQGSFQSAV